MNYNRKVNKEMSKQRLGKYRIMEEIGSGGFATVYRAMDTTLEREIALKVLDPLLMRDVSFVARFQQEARAAASLEHPHIVPIYEVGKGEGQLFIAMRLVRGGSLAKRLEAQGRILWDEALSIMRQASDALAYAHEQGVIHRDIKPQNILLDERSGAMLSDFGFARLVSTSTLTQSMSGGIVGTPAYIPPEIWEGAKATPATDVYALACVFYEMLTGRVLFGGETPMVVMRAHDHGAEFPEEWPIDIPPDAGEILSQALARQPEERYGSVPEFLGALEEVQMAVVAERIAAEVARLFDEGGQALDGGQFEAAVSAGKQLLELQPDHSEGARLLGEAQAKLTKQRHLVEQLAQESVSLDEKRQALAVERAKLAERREELEVEETRLAGERAEVEQRLAELDDAQACCEKDKADVQEQSRALRPQAEEVTQDAERLKQAAGLLKEGELQELERLFTRSVEPGILPRPEPLEDTDAPPAEQRDSTRVECPVCGRMQLASLVFCTVCGARLTGESREAIVTSEKPGRESRADAQEYAKDQAMGLALLAGLAVVFALVAFSVNVAGLGVILLIVAVVSGIAAIAKEQR